MLSFRTSFIKNKWYNPSKYSFINYTYLNQDGELQEIPDPYTGGSSDAELILAGQYTVGEIPTLLNYTGPKGVHTILLTPEYPDGVLQIYANYAVAFYRVRSYNRWKNSNEQNLAYRLRYGYGTVTLNEQEVPTTLEYMLGENLIVSAEPAQNGYDLGEFFFWPGAGATLEFDENITNTIVGDDSRFFVSEQFTPDSDQVQQIIFNEDDITYIGHKFKQEGVYVRVSRAENSFNFSINRLEEEGTTVNVIREASLSEEVGANMFELGGGEIQWNFGINPTEGGDPVIQTITYWNDSANQLLSVESMVDDDYGIELIGNMLTYTTPDNINSNNYYKYIDIVVYSEPV